MSCIKQITIISEGWVTGSLGTRIFFKPYNQYCYEDITSIMTTCGGCTDRPLRMQKHYRVVIDNEDFLLSFEQAIQESAERKDIHKDIQNLIDKWNEQPKDYKKVYKELTGADIDIIQQPQYNGAAIERALNGNGQSKTFGTDQEPS